MNGLISILYIVTAGLLLLNCYHFVKLKKIESEIEEIKKKNKELINDINKIKLKG